MAKLKIILPFVITAIIFAIIFHSFDYKEVFATIKSADIRLFLVSLLLLLASLPILTLRWKTLLKINNIDIGFFKILKYYLGNVPISKISPSNSGDLVRALYLKNELSLGNNIGIIVLENLLDILALLLLVLLGAIIYKNAILIIMSLLLILVIILFIIYGPKIKIKNEKWKQNIENFFLAKKTIIKYPKKLIIIFIYSIIPWLIIISCVKIFFLAFGANLSILTILATQPIVIFLGLLPITFSGIGVRESAMLFLYSAFAEKSVILAVGLSYSVSAAIILPLLCLPFLYNVIRTNQNYAK